MSNGNDLRKNSYPTCISQMYDYVFNEEEEKWEEEKKMRREKSASHFFWLTKWGQDVDSRIHLLHLAINKNKKHNQL